MHVLKQCPTLIESRLRPLGEYSIPDEISESREHPKIPVGYKFGRHTKLAGMTIKGAQ